MPSDETATNADVDMRKGGIMLLVFGGILLCFTILGAVLGVPMVLYGRHLWNKHGYADGGETNDD